MSMIGPAFLACIVPGLYLYVVWLVAAPVLLLEGSPSGQTVGKRAMSIRVIDSDTGGAIGTGRAVVRYFARWLSAIPCLLGYFWMLWDSDKQTWHDKLSSAVVVPTSAYPVAAWPG